MTKEIFQEEEYEFSLPTDSDDVDENITFLETELTDDEITEKLSSTSVGTALSSFQRSADKFPPLTPQMQNELARKYKESLRVKKLVEEKKLKGKELKEANLLISQSEYYMEHLCASCWRLAWMIVREQAERRFGKERAKPLLPDLMAEANSALVTSVIQFDPDRIPTFHTYAAQTIRDHMRAVLSKDSYLQLAPSWVRLKRIAVARMPELISELGRNPTKKELQDDLFLRCMIWAEDHLTPEQKKLPKAQKDELKIAKLRKQGMIGALRDIDQVIIATQSISSLDSTIGDEQGGSTLGDFVKSEQSNNDFNDIEHKELSRTLEKALGFLTSRERDVIIYRYGLGGNDVMKYSDLAEKLEISAERVRQIERTALAKLASPQGQFASLAQFLPSRIDSDLSSQGY